jgi:hypothetical protein
MNIPALKWLSAVATLAMASLNIAQASPAAVSQRIEPQTISLGEASRLTISTSGSSTAEITPPMVANLEFLAVGQSQRVESINGVTTSTHSVTYEVIPKEAGVYTIPGEIAGAAPVVLTVNPAGGTNGNTAGGASAMTTPPITGRQSGPAATHMTADGTAFVRLRLAKHELYVGETIPVDIEVGMRDGFVASLNGLPTLNGDEFTLNKLSSEPQKTEEIIDGQPFTLLTWHSLLSAVKPGTLSLTVETPLTVRLQTRARPDAGLLGEAGLDDFFNDPMFQNFFGRTTEKDITVASKPADFTVLALPTRDRPADFAGAVGHFSLSTDLSDRTAAVGDPVTLRMHVTGTGSFDRVTSPQLSNAGNWKTYTPTSTFKPGDATGYQGEKTFEEPVIATQAGVQTLPPVSFSWFDPSSRQYVHARTTPLSIDVTPSAINGSVAQDTTPPSHPSVPVPREAVADAATANGLHADHVISGGGTVSLTPYYYQPNYLGVPSALLLAFSGVWFWQRRRELAATDAATATPSLDPQPLVQVMDDARAAGDPDLFFKSARAALQRNLASTWHVPPEAITLEEVNTRLGPNGEIARLFALADETAYAGIRLSPLDYQQWATFVKSHINARAVT